MNRTAVVEQQRDSVILRREGDGRANGNDGAALSDQKPLFGAGWDIHFLLRIDLRLRQIVIVD
jgi:hypothetical protein